jgi:hypothetical protein
VLQKQRKIALAPQKTLGAALEAQLYQSVRAAILASWNSEFGFADQRNLHSPERARTTD